MRRYVHFGFLLFVTIYPFGSVENAEQDKSTETAKQFESTGPPNSAHKTGNSSFGDLRKCCKIDEIYQGNKNKCLPKGDRQLPTSEWQVYSKFTIHYNKPCQCSEEEMFLLGSSNSGSYKLHDNGSLIETLNDGLINYFNDFCIDYIGNDERLIPRPIICFCSKETPANTAQDDSELKFKLLPIAIIISILFLMATFSLYIVTPRLRKSVHDKCFLCHIFTLILAFCWLIAGQKSTLVTPGCTFIAYMIQFWFLASFFWLNTLCIDAWRSVRVAELNKTSSCRKFTIYCLYAWGCPLLVLVITLCVNFFLPKGHALRTGFGENYCWFSTFEGKLIGHVYNEPKFIFFYSIISITLLINFYTFIDTASKIIISDKKWSTSNDEASRRHKKQRTRFFLYLKLFLVMGLNWFIEVISYYFNKKGSIWLCLDVMNMLQGIPIFVIFIWNPRVIKELKRRFWPRKTFLKEYSKSRSDRTRTTTRFKSSITSNGENTNISLQ